MLNEMHELECTSAQPYDRSSKHRTQASSAGRRHLFSGATLRPTLYIYNKANELSGMTIGRSVPKISYAKLLARNPFFKKRRLD